MKKTLLIIGVHLPCEADETDINIFLKSIKNVGYYIGGDPMIFPEDVRLLTKETKDFPVQKQAEAVS